jgi:hypothetical protein
MDRLDKISKSLRDGKSASERRVRAMHRDGNQIIYGGYHRYDSGLNSRSCSYQLAGLCTQRADRDDLFECLPENCPKLQ